MCNSKYHEGIIKLEVVYEVIFSFLFSILVLHNTQEYSHGLMQYTLSHLKLGLDLEEMGVKLEVLLVITRKPGFPL